MFQPPDFYWKCKRCGYRMPGYQSDESTELPFKICPMALCGELMEKEDRRKEMKSLKIQKGDNHASTT